MVEDPPEAEGAEAAEEEAAVVVAVAAEGMS